MGATVYLPSAPSNGYQPKYSPILCPIADENDVMREQLEYLIGHTAAQGTCGCSECQRYLNIRTLLLAIFSDPCPV